MRHSESIKEIAAALSKAQAAMSGAKKDSSNPAFNSKYADLASVVEAAKKPLADNNLAVLQSPVTTDKDEIGVETLIMHASGEWIAGEPYFMPVAKANAHGFGSILTYARRYALAAMLGIAPEDDDANAGVKDPAQRPNTATQVAVDAFEALSDETKDFIASHAKVMQKTFEAKGDLFGYVAKQDFDNETKLALWSLLSAPLRAEYKRQQAAIKAPLLQPS